MSDADKRQTRQRALTIGACAAVFALGGPLISHRFEEQKSEESYRAGALALAQTLSEPAGRPSSASLTGFSNKAGVEDLLRQVSYEGAANANFEAARFVLAKNEAEEVNCLAEAVYYEARSEGLLGQIAVAEVVLNRVRDHRFPKTVCDVVYQGHYRDTGCQFTFTCDGSLRHTPSGDAWERARAVALNSSLGLYKPLTRRATHYHTDYVNPYWKAGMVETKVIGAHIFYRFPNTSSEWATARVNLEAQEQAGAAVVQEMIPTEPGGEHPGGQDSPSLVTVAASTSQAIPQPASQVADARPL